MDDRKCTVSILIPSPRLEEIFSLVKYGLMTIFTMNVLNQCTGPAVKSTAQQNKQKTDLSLFPKRICNIKSLGIIN